jgi:alkylation response protein AidB-like acyl-CoA dehydrogenase
MHFEIPPEDLEFREEVVAFVSGHRDVGGYYWRDGNEGGVQAFYRALGERGWLAATWPEQFGGMGRSVVAEYLLWNAIARVRAARPLFGSGIIAKSLMRHGTPEQLEWLLPRLRTAEVAFALGYSEPEAGSDLANVRTRAVRDGDCYVVSGEKRWTSWAHRADYLWLLCRTGTLEERHRGLTILILDLTAPGVTVSPIWTIDGGRLNEIRFDEVHVPVSNRVGEEGGAWAILNEALAAERHLQFPPSRLRSDYDDVRSWLTDTGCVDDPVVRHELAELAVSVAECEVLGFVLLEAMGKGQAAAEAAAFKLLTTRLCQRIARAGFELGAPASLRSGDIVEFLSRQAILETIGGGTTEMMRNRIAREGLTLSGPVTRRNDTTGDEAVEGLDSGFDLDQEILRKAVLGVCTDHGAESGPEFPTALWSRLAELGVLGIGTPEGGGGPVEAVAVADALGTTAVSVPYAAAILAAQVLPADERELVMAGESVVSVGVPPLMPWAPAARRFLVVDEQGVWSAVPRGAVQPVATRAGETWGEVELDRGDRLAGPEALAIYDLLLARYVAAAGLRLLELTSEYARDRVQFGAPIGTNQAVAHPLADAYTSLSAAKGLTWVGATALVAGRGTAAWIAAAARRSAERAAIETARCAHQTFAAIGYTVEGPVWVYSRAIEQAAALAPRWRNRTTFLSDMPAEICVP